MPPVVAGLYAAWSYVAVHAAFAVFSTGLVSWATAAAIAQYALGATLLFGASLVLRNQAKLPNFAATAAERTQMVRQSAASRRIVYGQCKLSGALAYMATSGATNEYMHMVVMLAAHEVEEIGDIYLNDTVVPLDGSGNATGTYAGYVRVKKHLGTAGQAADADLVSEMSSEWTSAHTLSGVAYIYVRVKFDAKLFPSGLPNFSALVKGRKVYDPRSGTTAYSTNAALCVYDYLTDTKYGLGVAASDIDSTEIQAAANICDESVTLATVAATSLVAGTVYTIATVGTTDFTLIGASANTPGISFTATGAGTGSGTCAISSALTESRYTCNGTVDTAEKPSATVEALLSAMAGRCVYAGGKWFIQAGAYRTPTVTFTEGDLRGGISVQTKLSRRELTNGVKGVFVSPANNWQATDFPAITSRVAAGSFVIGQRYTILTVGSTSWTSIGAASNTAGVTFTATGAGSGTGIADKYLGEDNGERLWRDIQLPFTTSSAMAQRLAKIELERSRRQIAVKTPMLLQGLKVQAGDNVMLTNTRLGWSAKVFEVQEFSFSTYSDPEGNPALGVDLLNREMDSNVWVWTAEDVALPSAPTTNLHAIGDISLPTSLTLTSGSSTVVIQPDGTVVPRLKVSWTAPADEFVTSGGSIRIQYKKYVDSDWTEWSLVRGDQVFDYITDVKAGIGYDVRIRSENVLGVWSAWVTSTNHIVVADSTAPATPSGLAAVVGTGKSVSLAWTANTEPDLSEYGIYRNTSNTPSGATKIAETGSNRFVDVDVVVGTTYYYWVTAFDTSENESAKSSGVSATPIAVVGTPTLTVANTTETAPGTVQKTGGSNNTWDAAAYSSESYANGCRLSFQSNDTTKLLIGGLTTHNPATSNGYSDIDYAIFVSSTSVDVYEAGVLVANIYGAGVPANAVFAITYDNAWVRYSINGVVYRKVAASAGLTLKFDSSFYTTGAVMKNVQFFPMGDGSGTLTAIAPSDPTAATLSSSGNYQSGDGTVFSYLTLSIPALPSGAAYQAVLYKKNGGGGTWMIAAQLTNTGSATLRLDDLTPGVSYDVATIAYSSYDVPSNIVSATSSPFTAPGKSASSADCTSVTPHVPSGSYPVRLVTDGGYRAYSSLVTFVDSTDKDVVAYGFGVSGVAATPPSSVGIIIPFGSSAVAVGSNVSCFQYDTYILSPQYLWYRTLNKSGVWSSWVDSGYNMNAYVRIASGDMVFQSSNDVNVSGIKTGSGSSVRQVVARYPFNGTFTLAGGSSEESFNVDLTNRGFTTKPDVTAGKPDVTSDAAYQCRYDWDDGSNSSTNAVLKISRVDGTNTAAGPVRVQNVFEQYA